MYHDVQERTEEQSVDAGDDGNNHDVSVDRKAGRLRDLACKKTEDPPMWAGPRVLLCNVTDDSVASCSPPWIYQAAANVTLLVSAAEQSPAAP